MKKPLSLQERLIVAADFLPIANAPSGRKSVRRQVLALAKSLKGTGVCIKVNSALRAMGYDLIDDIHSFGLTVFADLKLFDVDKTVNTDGMLLAEAHPEMVTVACAAGMKAMKAIKAQLPDSEVFGVTILTSITEEEAKEVYKHAVLQDNVCMLARNATKAELDGIICAPTEIREGRKNIASHMTINAPAIRPEWSPSPAGQNPARVKTPYQAFLEGADRIVVGSPIYEAKSPYDAVMKTLEEIDSALSKM